MFKKDFKNDIEGCVIQAEYVEYERTLVMDAVHVTDPELTPESFRLLAYLHTLGKTFKPNRKAMIKFMGSEHRLNKAMANLKKLGYLLTVARKNEEGKFCGQKWIVYRTKAKDRHDNFKQEQALKKISFNMYQASKNTNTVKPLETKDSTVLRNTQHGETLNTSASHGVAEYGDTVNHNALQRSYSYKDLSLSSISSLSLSESSEKPGEEREKDFKDFSKTPDLSNTVASIAKLKGFDNIQAKSPRLRAEASSRANESEIEHKRRMMQMQYEAMQKGIRPSQIETPLKTSPDKTPPSSATPPRAVNSLVARVQAFASKKATEALLLAETEEFKARRAEACLESVHPLALSSAAAVPVDVSAYEEIAPSELVDKLCKEHLNNAKPEMDRNNIDRFKSWFETHSATAISSVVEAFRQAKERGAYSIVSVERNLKAMGVQYVS